MKVKSCFYLKINNFFSLFDKFFFLAIRLCKDDTKLYKYDDFQIKLSPSSLKIVFSAFYNDLKRKILSCKEHFNLRKYGEYETVQARRPKYIKIMIARLNKVFCLEHSIFKMFFLIITWKIKFTITVNNKYKEIYIINYVLSSLKSALFESFQVCFWVRRLSEISYHYFQFINAFARSTAIFSEVCIYSELVLIYTLRYRSSQRWFNHI